MATPAPDAVKRLVDHFDQNRDAYLPGSWSLVSGSWFQEPRTKNQEPRMDRFEDADKRYNSGLFDFRKDTVTPSLKIDDKLLSDILSEELATDNWQLTIGNRKSSELYPPKSPYEFSVIANSVHGPWFIVPGTEGRKPGTKNQKLETSVVIRLTAGHQAKVEEKPEVRKAGGVHYTPQYIVNHVVKNTVGKLIAGKTPAEIAKLALPALRQRTVKRVCDSGVESTRNTRRCECW
jgi:hypothetical protein